MPGIVQLQNRNPWQQMLPGFLQNLMFNQMAAKREDEQLAAQKAATQGKEIRGYQAKGWRETGAHANAIKIGDKYYAPPEKGIEYVSKTVGGKSVLVPTETMTPIGGTSQYVKSGTPITSETKRPTTAMAAFLKKFPDATAQQIAAYQQSLKGKGLSVTQSPDGTLKVSYGGSAENITPLGTPTTATTTASQKNVKSLTERKSRLESMMQTWQPEYNTWLTKGTMKLRSLQEMAQGLPGVKPLTPESKQELAEYTNFRTNSLEDFARLIHDLGGGTLTRHETKTYGSFIQNAKSDSPTEYMTKMKQNYISVNKQLAREHYYLNTLGKKSSEYKNMLKKNEVSLASFDKIVDQKYAEYVTKLRKEKPNAPWEQIKAEAKGMIKASFFGF